MYLWAATLSIRSLLNLLRLGLRELLRVILGTLSAPPTHLVEVLQRPEGFVALPAASHGLLRPNLRSHALIVFFSWRQFLRRDGSRGAALH